MDRSNGVEKAIASLVFGIISIVSIFFGLSLIGLICGIIAIILGNRARREGGGGIATAGFVCGIIGTSFCALIFVSCSCALYTVDGILRHVYY